ncbi:IclR family transcriptional regulator [Singulisphaera sp. PoT]|uniref:IclR family transcriptional regulator n=1 Tax=Singulisphaera sp. PoT TaxID=3411797 RepID=UPI003BF56A08
MASELTRKEADAASPAVRQAFAIVECVAAEIDGLTLTEISERLELPKNAVFRITRTLGGLGYLDRETDSLRFRLTNKFLTLGQPRGSSKSLAECAFPAMRTLRDSCKETVQVGVRSEDSGVIVEVLDGLYPLRIAVSPGLRFKLHDNAPGKCLLAYLPESDRAELIDRLELPPSTSRTITDRKRLRLECDRIVARGFATDEAEADEGIHCLAAPIFDRHRQAFATIWVSSPSRRMPEESFAATALLVMESAAEISQELGK